MNSKLKHLEMIQGIINRMAGNSFLLKGWAVSIIAALFVLAGKNDVVQNYDAIAYFTILMFAILDGYYLYQEKLFRELYSIVSLKGEEGIDFSMDTSTCRDKCKWHMVLNSIPLAGFYGILLLLIIIL